MMCFEKCVNCLRRSDDMVRFISIFAVALMLAGMVVLIVNNTVCTKDGKRIECRVNMFGVFE